MALRTDHQQAIETSAADLRTAFDTGTPCQPLRTRFENLSPGEDIEVGYAIQRINLEADLVAGRRVVGRKVGLTSPVVQAQLGVDQPDF